MVGSEQRKRREGDRRREDEGKRVWTQGRFAG